jgi:hypothetical protein
MDISSCKDTHYIYYKGGQGKGKRRKDGKKKKSAPNVWQFSEKAVSLHPQFRKKCRMAG